MLIVRSVTTYSTCPQEQDLELAFSVHLPLKILPHGNHIKYPIPRHHKKKKNVPEIQMHFIKMRQHLSEIMNTIQSHILVCYNSCLLLGITWYCQEWVCAPPWRGGAAGGCGAPFYYFLEGREEGRMEETDLQAPAQCVHHPSNRHVKVRQAGKVIQQTCLLVGT